MENITKDEYEVNVENNTYFFEIGFKDEYMTKYEDVSLEKAQPVIDYLNECAENDECKIKYIRVIHGARYEKILNISKADLFKSVCNASKISLLYFFMQAERFFSIFFLKDTGIVSPKLK